MELMSKQMTYEGPVLTESLKVAFHVPTISFNNTKETTLLGDYKATDFDFSTLFCYHKNFIYTLIDIKILGFGLTVTVHRRRTK